MIKRLLTLLAFVTLSSAAHAVVVPGTYTLLDHPDAHLFSTGVSGPYGLRLDSLPPAGPTPTFSVELNGANVSLFWDGGSTATISGQVWNNATGGLWSVEQTLTGITSAALGFRATGGTLTITDPSSNATVIQTQQNSGGYSFLALGDNHRCSGHAGCGPLVGRGWFDAPYTNDWIVQLSPVPVPAALPLFTTGLLMLFGFLSRRNAK